MSKKAAKKANSKAKNGGTKSNLPDSKAAKNAKPNPAAGNRTAGSLNATGNPSGPAAEKPPNWTFLTNHSHVLILIKNTPEISLREVAAHVGITERAVQRIVHELDVAGYVTITRIGRKNHYWVNEKLHLRHPIEQDQTIGQLLSLVKPK